MQDTMAVIRFNIFLKDIESILDCVCNGITAAERVHPTDPGHHHGRSPALRLYLYPALLRTQLNLVVADLLHVSSIKWLIKTPVKNHRESTKT